MEPGDKTKIFLNTIIITSSTILEKIIFFLINIIVARYLAIGQYGEYTTALAFASFFSMFTDLGINQTMIRELNYEGEQDITIFNIVIFKVGLSILLFFIFLASLSFTQYNEEVILLSVIFGFVRFVDEYLRLYYIYFEAKDKYLVSALYRLLFSSLFLITIFIVILIEGGNIEIAWSRLIIVICFLIILTFKILKRKIKKLNYIFLQKFSKKTIPFASTFISSNIINQGNLLILPLLHGTLYTGVFQNAYMFLTTIMFIPSSFGRVFIPYLYQHNQDDNVDKFQFAFNILTKTYVSISFYIAIILFLYSDFIIITIFGKKYTDSIFSLKIISLAIPFTFNAAYIILTSLDKQIVYSRMLKYIAILCILLNIALGYYFKEAGTAAATVIVFILIFLFSNVLIKRNSKLLIRQSLLSYLKGIFFFGICWWMYNLLKIDMKITGIIITSLIFIVLNLFLLFTKDDLRIALEIIGKKKTD